MSSPDTATTPVIEFAVEPGDVEYVLTPCAGGQLVVSLTYVLFVGNGAVEVSFDGMELALVGQEVETDALAAGDSKWRGRIGRDVISAFDEAAPAGSADRSLVGAAIAVA
ncbi:hypothetical protein CSUB01_12002 [Colletotrichum sublineola]|uniref:Uncharacterized protein n=1 Tax=Colletotrichum sublineola TaxID=1173701 RepID=A0A066WVM5_COLSU|nr:hypothetical protein CSUB01_12002 [Colletotrichum sublineola]